MPFSHFKLCTEDILLTFELSNIPNGDFFKRGITRFISLRIDDFLKIGFRLNNLTLNSPSIRAALVELDEFYKEYFKVQRDKLGAHFQDLDYFDRLEYWSEINLDKATFFKTQAKLIYEKFQMAPGFISLSEDLLSDDDQLAIEQLNQRMNFETRPHLSGDILAYTRKNSGSILHSGSLQKKAGVLKTIELLIDYEVEALKLRPLLRVQFLYTKMFIVDLISYADNLISREDASTVPAADEPGLDFFLASPSFAEQSLAVENFKNNLKFFSIRSDLRQIRNQLAGHIDTNLPVVDMTTSLLSFEFSKYQLFFEKCKAMVLKLGQNNLLFSFINVNPYDTLDDVISMNGPNETTFDNQPADEYVFKSEDFDDILLMDKHWKEFIENSNMESVAFFRKAFQQSIIIDPAFKVSQKLGNNGTRFFYYKLKQAHKYFIQKLKDPKIENHEKKMIALLFIYQKRTEPGLFGYLLTKYFPKNDLLQLNYLIALSHLLDDLPAAFYKNLQRKFRDGNRSVKIEVLKCILRLDIRSRRRSREPKNKKETSYSRYLKRCIHTSDNFFDEFILSVASYASLNYDGEVMPKYLNKQYKKYFIKRIISSASDLMIQHHLPLSKDFKRTLKLELDCGRLLTVNAMVGKCLCDNGKFETGQALFEIACDGLIVKSSNDLVELMNLAYMFYKLDDFQNAIMISKKLIYTNPDEIAIYKLLLSIYSQRSIYAEDLIKLKAEFKNNYNLSIENLAFVDSL